MEPQHKQPRTHTTRPKEGSFVTNNENGSSAGSGSIFSEQITPQFILSMQNVVGNQAVQRFLSERSHKATMIRRALIKNPVKTEEVLNTEEELGKQAVEFLITKFATGKNIEALLSILEQLKGETEGRARTESEQALYRMADEKLWGLQVEESSKDEWTPESIKRYGIRAVFKEATKVVVNQVLKDKIPNAERILEIGSGMGFLSSLMDSPWRERLTRTDIGKDIVKYWSETKEEPNEDFYKAPVDATALTDKFGMQQFDAVVGQNVLDTIDSGTLAKVFSSIHQVLKPGGFLLHFMDVNAVIDVAYKEIQEQGNIPAPIVSQSGQLYIADAMILSSTALEKITNDTEFMKKKLNYQPEKFLEQLKILKENPSLYLADAKSDEGAQSFLYVLQVLADRAGVKTVSLDDLFQKRVSPLFKQEGFEFLGEFDVIPQWVVRSKEEVNKEIGKELPVKGLELKRGDVNFYYYLPDVQKEQMKLTIHVHVMVAKKAE